MKGVDQLRRSDCHYAVASGEGFSFPEAVESGLGMSVPSREFDGLCIAAFGNSAISSQFAADACGRSGILAHVASEGRLPGWAGLGTLVLVVSYAGRREASEALSEAKSRGCAVGWISSAQIGDAEDAVSVLPEGLSSSDAVGMEIGVLSAFLGKNGRKGPRDEVEASLPGLKEYRDVLAAGSVPVGLEDLRGKVPAFYALTDAIASARSWKAAFEPFCPMTFFGELTEFDHNEIVGWCSPNGFAGDLRMVVLRMSGGLPELDRTVDCMLEVLGEHGREVLVIEFEGGLVSAELKAVMLSWIASGLPEVEDRWPAWG